MELLESFLYVSVNPKSRNQIFHAMSLAQISRRMIYNPDSLPLLEAARNEDAQGGNSGR